jgi:hypothetical protein
MTRSNGRRARFGSLIAVALAACAIFALPGLAGAKHGSDDSSSDRSDSTASIKSFDAETQTLVVSLPDGQTVSGTVTRGTKIKCEDQSGRGRNSGLGSSSARRGSHDDNGSGANCGTADLVAGAAVEEIDLEFNGDTVRFDEVELDD